MTSLVPDRLARKLILVLLVIKMVVTVYDMVRDPASHSYDAHHHTWRVRSAGLEMGKMAYNPPLYYLPALPGVDLGKYYKNGKPIIWESTHYATSKNAKVLLEVVRGFNAGYLLVFYVAWIWFIFPHVLPSRRAWFLASLMLLVLPGFQKAAMMAHPDNLLMAASATATAVWVRYHRLGRERLRHGLLLGFLIGVVGLTRPFAIVPVFFLTLVTTIAQLKDALARPIARPLGLRVASGLGRAALVAALVGAMSGSWWAFRYVEAGTVLDAYDDAYVGKFVPLRAKLDKTHYYASFHFKELLKTPDRGMSGHDQPSLAPLGNTFPTIFYSETWGDHWLYFSGSSATNKKAWCKRILFVTALPLSIGFMVMLAVGIVRSAVRAVKRRNPLTPDAILTAIACAGWTIFVYWQGHAGLLPGKNSSIKFLYVAWVVPYAIATAFHFRPRARTFHALALTMLVVFAISLPIAIYDA
jgi:hypothetical protein